MKFISIYSSIGKSKIVRLLIFFILTGALLTSCNVQMPDINNWFVEPSISPTTPALPSSTHTNTTVSTSIVSSSTLPSETSTLKPSETVTSTPQPSITETSNVISTPSLSPTITLTPTRTLIPTRTRYPTFTPRPSRTRTVTLTPTPRLAYFRINNLGQFSFVTSPVRPEAIVSPGEDGIITVELIGEDGRSIIKENFNYQNFMDRHFGIAPPIKFDLNYASEYGRLIISTKDRFNRTIFLTSVDLILLEFGSNKITSPKDLTEPILIREPDYDETVAGGMIIFEGLARTLNTNPIIIECIDPDGNILCEAQVEIEAPNQVLSHIPFQAYLPYSVTESTNVRLTLRQESASRLPGTIYLVSYEITLDP